jgi:uncharacterized protein (UPF0335 family)
MAKSQELHPAAKYIGRIVSLEEEARELRGQIKDIYTEAKEAGHLKGAIRIVVKRQMEDEDARQNREAIESEADQIMAALGMLHDTPLGQAAAERAGAAPVESGYDAYQAGKKDGFIGNRLNEDYSDDERQQGAYDKGWADGQAQKVGSTIKQTPAPAAAPAKADGRRGRVMSDEQKAAMKAGRERAAALKAGRIPEQQAAE